MSTLSFDLNPSPQIKIERIGYDQTPIIIIDNFLKDPEAFKREASQRKFKPVTDNLYPGIRAPLPRTYLALLFQFLPPIIEKIYGLTDLDLSKFGADYSLITQRPETLQFNQCVPHYDAHHSKVIAVLHYLCTPEMGGTIFYRQRSTRLENIKDEESHLRFSAALKEDFKAAGRLAHNYILGDSDLFEQIVSVDAIFNRLVVYPGMTLHSGAIPRDFQFSDNPMTGRLTANVFLHFRSSIRNSNEPTVNHDG